MKKQVAGGPDQAAAARGHERDVQVGHDRLLSAVDRPNSEELGAVWSRVDQGDAGAIRGKGRGDRETALALWGQGNERGDVTLLEVDQGKPSRARLLRGM